MNSGLELINKSDRNMQSKGCVEITRFLSFSFRRVYLWERRTRVTGNCVARLTAKRGLKKNCEVRNEEKPPVEQRMEKVEPSPRNKRSKALERRFGY